MPSHFVIKLWLQNREGRLAWYRCDFRDQTRTGRLTSWLCCDVRDQTGPGCLTSWLCCDVEDQKGPSHALINMRCLRTKYINVFVTETCHFRAYGVQVLHGFRSRFFKSVCDFRDQAGTGMQRCRPWHYVCGGSRVCIRLVYMQKFCLHSWWHYGQMQWV